MAVCSSASPSRLLFHSNIIINQVRDMKSLPRHILSGNLALAPATPVTLKKGSKSWLVKTKKSRPLVLLFEYMNAKPKHVDKFVEFYNDRHFDVLTVNLKPWQLFWPVRGSHIVAKEVADFLQHNEGFSPILYHGFSVGGYLWGEVLRLCLDKPRYLSATNRVRGQIMDSGVDVTEIPTAFPAAVFPDSPFLKTSFEKFIRYQMKTFYNESTKHYIAARKAFTQGLIKGPTLLLYSDSDPLSTREINEAVVRELADKNLPVIMKEFKGSKHVMHFQKHKDEYLKELSAFLDDIDIHQGNDNTKPPEESNMIQSKL